jgi:hypothetical protein
VLGRWWKQSLVTCRGHCRLCHAWWGGDCFCLTGDFTTLEDKVRRMSPVPHTRCVVPLHDNARLYIVYTSTNQLGTADGTWFATAIQPWLGALGYSCFWWTGGGMGRGIGGQRVLCDDTVKAEVQKWLSERRVAIYRKGV